MKVTSTRAKIRSPFTGGEVLLLSQPDRMEYRGEMYDYIYYSYKCVDTGEVFTTDEIDDMSMGQVFDQYRAKHGIPSDAEIRSIRAKYDLPATTMSMILGLGENQYRLYEDGKMPSESVGKLILASANPKTLELFLEASKAKFGDAEFDRLHNRIQEVASREFILASDRNDEVAYQQGVSADLGKSEHFNFKLGDEEKKVYSIAY